MELEWLETIIKKHEQEKGTSRIVGMTSERAVPKGDNYCSDISRTTLDVILGSGKKTKRSVIVKCLPEAAAHRKFLIDNAVFKTEITFYKTFLGQLESLMVDFRDTEEKLWCEMIGSRNYDMIVLEDLKEDGFKVMNRREMLDLEHTLLAIRGLGRFHAMTKILLRNQQTSKADFKQYFFCEDENSIKLAFSNSLELMSEVMKSDWGPEWAKVSERLALASDTLIDKMMVLGKADESRFNVINHGDAWTNNMMFKHNRQKPVSVKFIDFQLSHYNSFAWDVTYFLYNSVRSSVRRPHYTEIIKAYHESVVETLARYDYPTEDLPTLEHINEEMKRLKYFGFLLLCSIHALTCADTTEAVDMEKIFEDEKNAKDHVNRTIYTNANYKNNVKDDLIECTQLGVF